MDGTHQLFPCSLTGDPALHFLWCLKKYKSVARSIQPPVPFCPPTGWNPDRSITMSSMRPITMSFMQLTTQLIHCHILICIIICYKPKGNIIFLSELKSDFISIETPWSGVNCHHFISYERPSLQMKLLKTIAYPIWLHSFTGPRMQVHRTTGPG